MKKILFLLAMLPMMQGCVSESKYNQSLATIDSLNTEIGKLKLENDELLNGENRLMDLIEMHTKNKDVLSAYNSILKLREKHPQSRLHKDNELMFSGIGKRAKIIIDSIKKVKQDSTILANINDLGIWKIGNYVNDFNEPTGEKYVYASVYGAFDNSATSGSELRVDIKVDAIVYEDINKLNFHFKFDEYNNGIFENEKDLAYGCRITNLKDRIAYRNSSSFIHRFYNVENEDEIIWWKGIIEKEGEWDYYMKFKYGTTYTFKVNSHGLHNALLKAGIIKLEDVLKNKAEQ